MYVWSKRLVAGLLTMFTLFLVLFLALGLEVTASSLKPHTTFWILLNYAGLVLWLCVWMFDQARVRGKNVWVWLPAFLLAPLPTLMAFILFLQRRLK
ncbi:hypothetical protein [Nitrospira sp. Kam-Ns4a]